MVKPLPSRDACPGATVRCCRCQPWQASSSALALPYRIARVVDVLDPFFGIVRWHRYGWQFLPARIAHSHTGGGDAMKENRVFVQLDLGADPVVNVIRAHA